MKPSAAVRILEPGFRGVFYECDKVSAPCFLILMGDDEKDLMNTSCARWLRDVHHCHALSIGIRQEEGGDTGLHGWPLEHIEAAVSWLNKRKITKTGIIGISMQASLALTAASLIPELSLVLALSPNDFVPWGFYQGKIKNSAHGEWPSGTSAFSWRGKELPFQPAGLEKEAYWAMFCREKKKHHEIHTRSIFDYSETVHPVKEDCFIPVEAIQGKLILAGAEDDVMWDAGKYIRRMEQRLVEKKRSENCHIFLYPYGTHLLFPEKMIRKALPFGGDLVSCMFRSGRKHRKECKEARIDLETRLSRAISDWKHSV